MRTFTPHRNIFISPYFNTFNNMFDAAVPKIVYTASIKIKKNQGDQAEAIHRSFLYTMKYADLFALPFNGPMFTKLPMNIFILYNYAVINIYITCYATLTKINYY
jgi:hypothetical protein